MAFKLNFISLFKIIYKNIESNCKNIEEDCAAEGCPMYLTRLQTYTFYVNDLLLNLSNKPPKRATILQSHY